MNWQPIETAPSDGQLVLVWNSEWDNEIQFGYAPTEEEPEWVAEGMMTLDPPPTHWLPIVGPL